MRKLTRGRAASVTELLRLFATSPSEAAFLVKATGLSVGGQLERCPEAPDVSKAVQKDLPAGPVQK